jgi:hypothetical protein
MMALAQTKEKKLDHAPRSVFRFLKDTKEAQKAPVGSEGNSDQNVAGCIRRRHN